MNFSDKTLLQFNNLTLEFDSKVIFRQVSGSIARGDKIGLVGINGSGKSTLLKTLAGLQKPQTGTIESTSRVNYVPQLDLDLYRREILLTEYLQEQKEEWWEILLEYERLFNTTLDEQKLLSSLSGGELVKLLIAISFADRPDVILLDEPTNHLDLSSLRKLVSLLQNTDMAFVVVSHNIDFLNQVIAEIWELHTGELTIFGGNYDFYKEQQNLTLEARQRAFEAKRKELRKLARSKEQEQKRAERTQRMGVKMKKTNDRSTGKSAMNFLRNSSQKISGKRKLELEKREEQVTHDLNSLKVKNRKGVYLDLNAELKEGLLVSISNGALIVGDQKLITDINLSIYHQNRIAILGDNGSGKTTLVKQLSYGSHSQVLGEVNYGAEYKTLYVDQKYDLVKPELTIVENLQINNPALTYESIRRILSNLSFSNDYDISQKASSLSGGETARLAFAIATSSEIDMLILDEPTNNLDIETVEHIAEALIEFKGCLVVISHDINFLERIRIERKLEIHSDTKELSIEDAL